MQYLYSDSEGYLWIGTYAGGLDRLDPETGVFTHYRNDPDNAFSLSHNRVWCMVEDDLGRVWVGTENGLNRLEKDGRFFQFWSEPGTPNTLSDDKVRAILKDRRGYLWIGTERGLDLMDPLTGSFLDYMAPPRPNPLSERAVNVLYEDPEGLIWVGTHLTGLYEFRRDPGDAMRGHFLQYTNNPLDPNSISQNDVRAVYRGNKGLLWVGTRNGGINKIDLEPYKFKRHRIEDAGETETTRNRIHDLEMDEDNQLWLGTLRGLFILDRATGKRRQAPHDPEDPTTLSSPRVTNLFRDRTGHMWVGTFDAGVNRYDPRDKRYTRYREDPDDPYALSSDAVKFITEDHSGKVWIATTMGGLNRFNAEDETFTHYRHDPGNPASLGSDHVTVIRQDNSGRFWVGTYNNGIDRFDLQNEIFHHFTADLENPQTLQGNRIGDIKIDSRGIIWIGSFDAGLSRVLDPDVVDGPLPLRHYTMKNGLPNDVVYAILEDDDGYLWLSTDHGLARFDPIAESFRNYDTHDGLNANVFNSHSAYRSRQGELFFGNTHGFNSFFPKEVRDNPNLPRVVITSIEVFNEELPLARTPALVDRLELNHDDSVVSFTFAALDYKVPEKNRYRYRLVGFDKDWTELASSREVTYTNLDPGGYIFEVMGSNNDGIWNPRPTRLNLEIVPPIWETWWAYSLYGLLLIGLVLYYQTRQNRKLQLERMVVESLQRNDRLKDEFLANTSHELRTPLNGIIGIVESLIDGATGTLPDKTRENLSMVAGSARRLSNLVNDILDFSRMKNSEFELSPVPLDLRDAADNVLGLCRALIGDKDLRLSNDMPKGLPSVYADENRLHQVLYNLVGNAIKFTDAGLISVSAALQNDHIMVSVSDTGIGIEDGDVDRIFESFEQADGSTARIYGGTGLGLAITRKLVELHGGEIQVHSVPGQGSVFTFDLPISEKDAVASYDPCRTVSAPAGDHLEFEPLMPDMSGEYGGRRILVVDDDPVNLQVMINNLSLLHASVTIAHSGPEALEILGGDEHFDVMLLDIMMPKMSGYEVCRIVRQSFSPSELPILLLTAKTQVDDLVRGFQVGANDYLVKPIHKGELLARLQTHLKLLETSRDLVQSKVKLEEVNQTLEAKVTDRTRDLRERNQELVILEKIVREINREMALDALLERLLEQAMSMFNEAERGLFCLVDRPDDDEAAFVIAASRGYGEGYLQGKRLPVQTVLEGIQDDFHQPEKGVYVFKPNSRQSWEHIFQLPSPKSRLAMDVQVANRLEGFLLLDNYSREDAFAEEDVAKLIRLREHAVSAVAKSRILKQLQDKNEQILATQAQLLDAAHDAGMAEIATNVLHNVGNALTSVKTTVNIMARDLDGSAALAFYERMIALIMEHEHDLGAFFSSDPRADKVPQALTRVKREWRRSHEALLAEVRQLEKNVYYIDNIVESQRAYAAAEGLVEEVELNQIVSTVLQIQRLNLQESEVTIETEFEGKPMVHVQKSKFVQVLNHLITNAVESLERSERRAPIRITGETRGNQVLLRVADEGVGIEPDDLTRIFTQGYSRGRGRFGSGLHYCANAMMEMEGRIWAESEGKGRGAVFTLELPMSVHGTRGSETVSVGHLSGED